MNRHSITAAPPTPIPVDDPSRPQKIAHPDTDAALLHIGVVGDTYTVLLSGEDTDGRYCLIDMHVPPGGGPPPHRHDFEESFTVLAGEIEAMFRGEKQIVATGTTLSIPANAPHAFKNIGSSPARLLCICAPAGQEEFFEQIGVKVSSRMQAPPKPTEAEAAAMKAKIMSLLPKFRSEMVK